MDLMFPIRKGLQDAYDLIEIKDSSVIYITTDSKRIYLGDILISENYQIEKVVKDIAFNETNQIFTITYTDSTTEEIDLVLESVIKDIDYNTENNVLTFTLVSGATTDIDLTDLVNIYTVVNSQSINMDIEDGEISSELNISSEDNNQAEIKTDGLYVKETLKPIIEDNIVTGSGSDIKDSGRKFVSTITDETSDSYIPDVESIKRIMAIGSF